MCHSMVPARGPAWDPRARARTAGSGAGTQPRCKINPNRPMPHHVALSRPTYPDPATQTHHLGQEGVRKRPLGPRGATLGGPLAEKRPVRRAQNATQVYCSPALLYKTVSWPARAM